MEVIYYSENIYLKTLSILEEGSIYENIVLS